MAGIPGDIILRALTPETKKVLNPPVGEPKIATKAAWRDGSRTTLGDGGSATEPPLPSSGTPIFEESFDNIPDWTSDTYDGTEATLPGSFNLGRMQGDWSPATGHADKHPTVEILAANTAYTRTGAGKSYVKWREGRAGDGQNNFHTDSILAKYFTQYYTELYCEFHITFSGAMIAAQHVDNMGSSKLFRILSLDITAASLTDFNSDTHSPKFIWGAQGGPLYGFRNFQAYYAKGPNHTSLPVLGTLNGGDWTGSYKTDLVGMRPDGSNANLPNKVNGGFISDQAEVPLLDHVFGTEGVWTKVAFYVKMNSAPGVQDGQVMQWIDGQRILFANQIDWVRDGYSINGWNYVAVGGNDLIKAFPIEQRYEDWYAIDDLKVYNGIPDGVER